MFLNFLPPILNSAPGLFDLFSPQVGFSLRRAKNTGANRYCVRIRRDSDSDELDIGWRNGLVDTAAIADFCDTASGFVRTWYDQVGTNHAQQSANLLQPRIFNAGTLETNEFGLPTISFIDPDLSTTGPHLEFDPWHTASVASIDVFSVYSLPASGNFPFVLGSDPLDRGLSVLHNAATRLMRTYSNRSTVTTVTASVALNTDTTTARYDCSQRGGTIAIYRDESATASVSGTDASTDFSMPTKYRIGNTKISGTVSGTVKIPELFAFNSNQAANQLAIRSNMYRFWRAE